MTMAQIILTAVEGDWSRQATRPMDFTSACQLSGIARAFMVLRLQAEDHTPDEAFALAEEAVLMTPVRPGPPLTETEDPVLAVIDWITADIVDAEAMVPVRVAMLAGMGRKA